MAEENPFAMLGALSAQILGTVAVLMQELAASNAVDKDRLLKALDAFYERNATDAPESEAEKRVREAVQAVIRKSIEKGGEHGQRG